MGSESWHPATGQKKRAGAAESRGAQTAAAESPGARNHCCRAFGITADVLSSDLPLFPSKSLHSVLPYLSFLRSHCTQFCLTSLSFGVIALSSDLPLFPSKSLHSVVPYPLSFEVTAISSALPLFPSKSLHSVLTYLSFLRSHCTQS